jgi:hypothetical protein
MMVRSGLLVAVDAALVVGVVVALEQKKTCFEICISFVRVL